MKFSLLFLFLSGGFTMNLWAQEIAINQVDLLGDSVAIRYTLSDMNEQRSYTVRLFAILNGDTLQLKQIAGGFGEEVFPGDYEIVWDALTELGRFRGNAVFYITAVPSFFLDNPLEGESFKRGNPVSFTWYGGNSNTDDLNLELYQYDTRIDSIITVSEASQYTWLIPSKIPPGKGYRIKVTGTNKTGIESFSNSFIIKRKVPLFAIIVPAAAVVAGTVAYLVLGREPLPLPAGGLPVR